MLIVAEEVIAGDFKIADFDNFSDMQQAITNFVKLADEGITIDWSRSYIMHTESGAEVTLIAL